MSKCTCKYPDLSMVGTKWICNRCYKVRMSLRKTWTKNPETIIEKNKKQYNRKNYNIKEDLDE